MNALRNHWYDLGIVGALGVALFLIVAGPGGLAEILWINLLFLFLHQFEEYRFPGYFPGMINTVLFASPQPDRFPLNTNTAMLVNLLTGWSVYALAAVLADKAVYLGIAAVLVSVGNVVGHTFLFNLKGRTFYNPGMFTALTLFLPVSVYFFYYLIGHAAATPADWIAGVALGIVLNYVGIVKLILWLKNENTPYVFPARFLIPSDRQRRER